MVAKKAAAKKAAAPVVKSRDVVAPASIASGGARAAGTAHVFVDYSNLWWGSGAKDEGKTLSIGALDELLRGGRALGECSLVVG